MIRLRSGQSKFRVARLSAVFIANLTAVGLRFVYAFIILLAIAVFTWQREHLPTKIPEKVTSAIKATLNADRYYTCPDDARSKVKVSPPAELDRQRMRVIWNQLDQLFKENKPVPEHLEKPPRPKDGSDPDIAKTREQVKISKGNGQKTRELHEKLVAALPNYPDGLFSAGRGVVMLAGAHYSEPAATGLGMLRELGSHLPVEVWMIKESEELEGWCAELEAEGMACRRLSDYIDVGAFKNPYQYKAMTMLFSGFEEMVFLDADAIPLKDPQQLLESKEYNATGAMVWPDYWESIASPHLPFIVGLTNEWDDHRWYDLGSFESGQMVWDKKRHWKLTQYQSLLLATYYNYHGPDFWYTLLSANFAGWGDKETFALALRALSEPFYHVRHKVVEVKQVANSYQDGGHGIAMLQGDPRNDTAHNGMFLHCQIIKFSMREFFCDGCHDIYSSDAEKPIWRGVFEKPGDFVYENLHVGLRILQQNVFDKDGLDPEPLLFKAIEHTACRSKAWGSEQLCMNVRRYMHQTFGFKFVEMATSVVSKGKNETVDIVDKLASPNLCVAHPKGWKYFDEKRRGW